MQEGFRPNGAGENRVHELNQIAMVSNDTVNFLLQEICSNFFVLVLLSLVNIVWVLFMYLFYHTYRYLHD